jgi:hypothetical protein
MQCKVGLLSLFLLASCGGASQGPAESDKPLAVRQSENGIEVVRKSFQAMGGLERLRLIGAQLAIKATVVAQGKSFPVEITLGGPNRWHLNYVSEMVQYMYVDENCIKVAYGTPSRCTKAEAAWMEPTRILNGLLFPAGDAANLKAVYRYLGERTVDGQVFDIVQIKSQKTDLVIRAMYSGKDMLLARATFDLTHITESTENRTTWSIHVSDWREISGARVPFTRTVLRNGIVVWTEIAGFVDIAASYESIFAPPIPPITNQPRVGVIPTRRVVQQHIMGRTVEVPAPYPVIGGGPDILGAEPISLPPVESALYMTVKGNLSDLPQIEKILTDAAVSKKRGLEKKPKIILLEDALVPGEPVLMILYLPLRDGTS